ncbi:hypothetical protein [Roseofilum casamattae]|uniref:Uncharacterized protein n=1 Tax=Roseofilum casamattae BLCC-M143 TaxID=3022442 RepID=A0ABT7C278_9CYAN|nr:hypothetical protein [Roseofilum casamattae]MDJ1184849.1 hypothetical protein [Roseofilum casamattae BLCC-M143]
MDPISAEFLDLPSSHRRLEIDLEKATRWLHCTAPVPFDPLSWQFLAAYGDFVVYPSAIFKICNITTHFSEAVPAAIRRFSEENLEIDGPADGRKVT